jgi:ABC-type multidrug transport system ATPase subunit
VAAASHLNPARIEPVLAAAGLAEAADRHVGEFSLGMRQLSVSPAPSSESLAY